MPSEPDSLPGPFSRHRIVVATADDDAGRELTRIFEQAGLPALVVESAQGLSAALSSGLYDVAVVDVGLAGGTAMISTLLEEAPDVRIIAMAAAAAAHEGVNAVRLGAVDFIHRPPDRDEVRHVLSKALKLADSEDEEREPPASIRNTPATRLVARAAVMVELERTIRRVARGVATVLVRGETGTGKELVARRLHEQSERTAGPFVKVDCGALPDNLLESELFGHEKGAFTGAVARKPGRVELAEGGTLFLDEIGEVTPLMQVKLLRVLQDREFEPLGGTRTHKADVRFVAATHRDLEALVAAGKFREDLFYRLNVVSLRLPALRERPEDIEPLALHFCHELAKKNGRGIMSLDPDALDLVRQPPWPGNVRQLQNFIERLVVLSQAPRITKADVERELGGLPSIAAGPLPPLPAAARDDSSIVFLDAAVLKAERRALEKALKSAKGNRAMAARLLGISVRTLYYKLGQHELD